MDGDGDLDVVGAASQLGQISWWANNGDGTSWTPHLVDGDFDDAMSVVVGDINSDGHLDIIAAATEIGSISWWANNGDGSSWTKQVIDADFGRARSVIAADLDADGDLDLAGMAFDDGFAWWENESIHREAAFPVKQQVDDFDRARFAKVGDIDKDGDLDIVAVGYESGK